MCRIDVAENKNGLMIADEFAQLGFRVGRDCVCASRVLVELSAGRCSLNTLNPSSE